MEINKRYHIFVLSPKGVITVLSSDVTIFSSRDTTISLSLFNGSCVMRTSCIYLPNFEQKLARARGTAHNDRIDKWVQKAQSTKGVDNIRKNQQQVDVNGKRVGTNRPDLQFDYKGKHYNLEWDNSARASARHRRVVTRRDPKSISKFFRLFK